MADDRHHADAGARHLAGHPKVARVHYPGLGSDPGHDIATRQMTAFGAILSFDLADENDAPRIVESLRMILMAPTLGGPATTVTVPAAPSHFSPSPERRRSMGIGDGLVHLSAEIEETAGIIGDLDEALG